MDANLTPATAVPAPPTTQFPEYRLFDSTSVLIAAFLGSPIAGATLMSLNYRRMGDREKTVTVLILGVVATVLGAVIGYLVPSSSSIVVGILFALGTRSAANYWQGAAIAQHEARGGQLSSRWAATGVGLAFLAVFSTIVIVGALGLGGQHRVLIGTNDEVFYLGSATKQDAQALGEALKTAGYFKDLGFAVVLSKDQDGTAISFVVKEGAWDDPQMALGFQQIGRQLAPAVGGLPIKVRLINSLRQTKKEFTLTP
jgi:hypothetical protein